MRREASKDGDEKEAVYKWDTQAAVQSHGVTEMKHLLVPLQKSMKQQGKRF